MSDLADDGFPRLQKYIAGLPSGLDSYPQCQSRGAILRDTFENVEPAVLLQGLPPVLADYIRYPAAIGLWTPSVHYTALFLAVCDVHYPTVELMQAWARRRTMKLGTGLYRGLARLSGPRVFFRLANNMHMFFQKGMGIETNVIADNHLEVTLTFPPKLRTHFILLANESVYEVIADFAGAKDAKSTLVRWDSTSACYDVRWRLNT